MTGRLSGITVLVVILGLILGLQFIAPAGQVFASSSPQEIVPTQLEVVQPPLSSQSTITDWWLVKWKTNQVRCVVPVDHQGWPSAADIQANCSNEVFLEWSTTPSCARSPSGSMTNCPGVYLHQAATRTVTGRTIAVLEQQVNLPKPEAWLSLSGCSPLSPENTCDAIPPLVIFGKDPQPEHKIVAIEGTLNGTAFRCDNEICTVQLLETGAQPIPLEFWAVSSKGNSSNRFHGLIRVEAVQSLSAKTQSNASSEGWHVDILSSQWGGYMPSCALTWESLPKAGGPTEWLITPQTPQDLSLQIPLYYLAGQLIKAGQVDVQGCPDGGLQDELTANTCGMERARGAVAFWQNQFDAEILDSAQMLNIPARLLKSMFFRESQFWPGIYTTYREAGLGQMTENGADTVLLWNQAYFQEFCPQVLSADYCKKGYTFLAQQYQDMLKGALVQQVNSTCEGYPTCIDVSRAEISVNVFSSSLLANCEQTGHIIYNATQKTAGSAATYEDLWRFTLVNYHAGPGCLSSAVLRTVRAGQSLTWDNVKVQFDPTCSQAIDYVNDIERIGTPADPRQQQTP